MFLQSPQIKTSTILYPGNDKRLSKGSRMLPCVEVKRKWDNVDQKTYLDKISGDVNAITDHSTKQSGKHRSGQKRVRLQAHVT